MRRGIVVLAAVLCCSLPAVPAAAQTCAGTAPFSAGPIQLGGRAQFGNASRFLGGALQFGSARAFGGLSAGAITYDDLDGTTFSVGGTAGLEAPIGSTGRGQLCPYVSGGLGFGPSNINGSNIDLSTADVGFGLRLGYAAEIDPETVIVPTGGIALAYGRSMLKDGVGTSVTDSNTYGVLSFGVGFVLSSVINLRPSVAIPFGLEGADPTFGLLLALSIGAAGP